MKSFMAVVVSPDGIVWESSACVATGFEAESRARRNAESAFVSSLYGHLFKDGLDRLTHSVWAVARDNGFKCHVMAVEIDGATS